MNAHEQPQPSSADEEIYLSERNADEPKRYFVAAADILENWCRRGSVLDAGCAGGEFLQYLHMRSPLLNLFGVDSSAVLVGKARKVAPTASFKAASVLDGDPFGGGYDCVTAFGLLSLFEDPRKALRQLVSWVRPGGRVLFLDMFNKDPVDVVVRYRRADAPDASWEGGWNSLSLESLGAELRNISNVKRWDAEDFVIDIDLPKRSDVLRTWTVQIGGKRQLVNGLGQLVNMHFVKIET